VIGLAQLNNNNNNNNNNGLTRRRGDAENREKPRETARNRRNAKSQRTTMLCA